MESMDPSHNSVIERLSSSPPESKPETKKKIVLDDEDADAADDDKTLKKKKTTMKTKKKKPGSLPLIMFLSLDEETPRDCINSSNPFHKCADHCFRRTKSAEDGGKANKKVADHTNNSSSCANASNPFHVCADTCFVSHKKNTLPPYNYNKDRQAEPETVVVEKPKEKTTHHHHRMVHPLCPNASNPFHICVQLCLQKIADKDKPKEEEEEDHVQRKIIPNKDQAEKHVVVTVTAKEKKESVQVTERMVHPLCSYASNPFHICVEACFQTIPVKQSNTHVPASKGGKENIVEMAKNNNNGGLTKCKNASNPFHTCADHCSSFQA